MTKVEIFKKQFPELCSAVNFFTDDCEQVNFIDVESNLVEFTTTVTARCGCCSDVKEHAASLDEFFEFISDEDFEILIEQLTQLLMFREQKV